MQKHQTVSSQGPRGRGHVIRSSIWVAGGQVGGQILRLASNLVMTRLLVPEMFGVMAVANTVITGLALCSYIGVHHNVIQSPRGDERVFLNTAWTIQILRGGFLWLLALLVAGGIYLANYLGWMPISSAYADESLPMILAVLSFTSLISGFEPTKYVTASRHMQVPRLIITDLVCQVVGISMMVIFALIYRSVWALVVGAMFGAILKVILGYIVFPGENNQLAWERESVSELFGFGKWILLTTILGFLVRNIDKLILGAIVTPQLLGIYSIATFMTSSIRDILGNWANGILLPVFSRVQRENSVELSTMYYRVSLPFNLATLFLCGFLYKAGFVAIELLYDSRYQSAGYMVQVLSLTLLASRTVLAEQVYLALGKPKLSVPMNVIQLVVLLTALVPSFKNYGMSGALYVIAVAVLLTLPPTWYFLRKFGILNIKKEFMTLPALFVGYGFAELFLIIYRSIRVAILT